MTEGDGLEEFLETWPRSGLMHNGTAYKLPDLTHFTEGIEFGLLPTPTARDWKDNGKSPAELVRNSTTLATIANGPLNPNWIEWLMGYPQGFTELKD